MPFDDALEARAFTSPLAAGRIGAFAFGADAFTAPAFGAADAPDFADAFDGADRGVAGRCEANAGASFMAA